MVAGAVQVGEASQEEGAHDRHAWWKRPESQRARLMRALLALGVSAALTLQLFGLLGGIETTSAPMESLGEVRAIDAEEISSQIARGLLSDREALFYRRAGERRAGERRAGERRAGEGAASAGEATEGRDAPGSPSSSGEGVPLR